MKRTTTDVLPHDMEAETSILGAAIVDPRVMDLIADRVQPRMFYRQAHQWIYEALLEMYRKGSAIDPILLKGELQKANRLDEAGGLAYLAKLGDGIPRSTNVGFYAKLLKEKSAARDVITLCQRLLEQAYSGESDVVDLVEKAERGLLEISGNAVPGDPISSEELVRHMWPVLQALAESKRPSMGIPTGFPRLDGMTRGLQPGALVVVAARPSSGKTTFASQVVLHAAVEHVVLYFSVEMGRGEQGIRIVAHLAGIDGHRMQFGSLTMFDQERIGPAMAQLRELKMWIDDSTRLSALQIRSRARRLKARHGLGLIVIDYLSLLQLGPGDRHDLRVGETTRLLKEIARELEVPVVLLCQLSRDVEKRGEKGGNVPRLSDLRDSGSIEQDADLVFLLYREQTEQKGGPARSKVIVAKNRNGPTGAVSMEWIREQYRFREAEDPAS